MSQRPAHPGLETHPLTHICSQHGALVRSPDAQTCRQLADQCYAASDPQDSLCGQECQCRAIASMELLTLLLFHAFIRHKS